jgi:electron transport complex protein RnfB
MDDYEKLREILDKHIAGAPPSKRLDRILRILFTPEEVRVAVGMIFVPMTVEEIATRSGVPVAETRAQCESMANKAIVFSREKNGIMGYALLPTIPGVFEFPFMKGGGEPMHRELAKLWEEYHREALGNSFASSPTPITRVLPVEKAIDTRVEVLPFEVISKMLDRNETFALADCACRVSVEACQGPRDVCLIFDATGRFLIDRGFAREITKQEALDVVRRSEEAGLVHTTNNSQDRLSFICNCCPCCCTVLRGLTQLKNPHAFAVSQWCSQVDADLCNACGICEDERCPVSAINVTGPVAEVDSERCIGCGLCVTGCDAEAVHLVKRQHPPDPPQTMVEMGLKIAAEKGKTEDFIKLMRR